MEASKILEKEVRAGWMEDGGGGGKALGIEGWAEFWRVDIGV